MRRLKKKLFLGSSALLLGTLFIVRISFPEVTGRDALYPIENEEEQSFLADSVTMDSVVGEQVPMLSPQPISQALPQRDNPVDTTVAFKYHPVKGVYSYQKCFPDLQDVHIVAARQWGVSPIADRKEAEQRKDELVYVGASPYYDIDSRMNRSIPYLVPRASVLLQRIGRSFMDSLCVKGLPMHKVIVSSVLRTNQDIKKLRKSNVNATEQSCHRFGTTFDIAYGRYNLVTPSYDPNRKPERDETLKRVLSEVLRDFREQGHCYVKYERKQGCFHITVR